MYVIALTGGIGAGKSTVSALFAELGVAIIDLDKIAHQLTTAKQPLVKKIASVFGEAFISNDNAINRPAMRDLVFNDKEAREKLNAILHPAIYNEVKKSLHAISNKTSEASYVILEIPLLAKNSSYYSLIDRVLVVDCGEKSQIDRVMQRSQLTEIEIKKIINAQPSRQVRLALADDVIKNDTNAGNLVEKIGKLHQKYINTCIVSKTIS